MMVYHMDALLINTHVALAVIDGRVEASKTSICCFSYMQGSDQYH